MLAQEGEHFDHLIVFLGLFKPPMPIYFSTLCSFLSAHTPSDLTLTSLWAMFIECRYWMAVPMSLIISEASINTILEKGHINIPTVTQGHAWECLRLTNSLLEYRASVKTRKPKISPNSCVLVLQATIPPNSWPASS